MLVSEQQSASNDGAQSQDPIQTESECQWSLDPLFDNLLPGGLRSAGPPEHQHGGFGMSDFNPGWPLRPNMAGQPAYHSPEINFGTSPINQGFNSSIPSHMAAQQHQSNTGNHFPPSNPPLNNFSSPELFDPTGFPNAASLVGLGRQNQPSGLIENNQSSVPLFETQMLGGGHVVPTQQFATHGASVGVQSLQANLQAAPIAGSPFQAPINSQSEPQATRGPPLIPSHPNGLVNSGLPIPAPGPDVCQDEGNVHMPDWIALVKPSPPAGENVVTVRRDTHVALDINFERLPRQPPGGCDGIKIPATASVRNFADTTGKTLLEFRIHVSGATSKRRYETVCASCEKREGNKNAAPSFIDFCAMHDIIEQKDGKVRVEFEFCCYPKCNHDSGYFLDVVLSEDVNQENIVAQYRLPFSFNIVAKLAKLPPQKRTRRQMEQPEEPSVEDRRNVRALFHDFSQRDADHERNDDPMLAVSPRNALQGGQYHEGGPSNVSPPTVSPPPPPQNAGGPLSPWKRPNPVITPPITDAEPTPTLTDVNPEQGSITGGARIWLKGMDFPAHFPLFARFGTAVVPTTFSAGILLACSLPPATTPGVVDVTLSKHPRPNAPEYGTSIAKFRYVGDHAQLIPMLLRFQEQGYPEFSPVLQALLMSLNGPQPNHGLQGGSHGAGPREDPIETSLIEALSSLQARPKFHEIVSTPNEYYQTLAHLSILYGYPSLLSRLVEWHIDLTIADVNGLTALHCAYMKGDLDSVHILRRGGASEIVTDKLGRTPSELQPEGLERFDSDTDPEAALAGLDAGVYPVADNIDEQLTIGKQFSALDFDNCIDPGHGQLDSEDDASEDQKGPVGTVVDSLAGSDEGDNGGVSGGSGGLASGSGGAQIASNSKDIMNPQQPRQVLSVPPPLSSTSHPGLEMILVTLELVGASALAVCEVIDKAIELEHEERHALKELREGVASLKSDTLAYKVLLNPMENDTDLSVRSPYTVLIQQQDGKEAMKSLEKALKATRLLLKVDPDDHHHKATVDPFGSMKPRRALHSVLNALKANFRPELCHELIDDLKDATSEIFVCQQNNERAFKHVWNLYVVAQQSTGGRPSVDNIGNIQDRVGQAFDSVLHAFHMHPFAVTPEVDSRVNLPTLAILNHNHETATRHEKLARRIGKAWVDDRVYRYNAQVRDIGALQTSLLELLWSGTVEQLKRESAYSADDPERPEVQRTVVELERALHEAIIRSKKPRFAIAFCGMVKSGKSLFLNALMGRAILPSDELPSTAWPCRLRHVEGQTVPELQFHAEPFLVALKKLQAHQYGQKMRTYQPPLENIYDELSYEEIFLRTIHSRWIDLHAVTRDNLLKFETPGFRLPGMATGEQNVKVLLGQLNDIVRLCQRFDLKFDMSKADWPLLTVEFNSLRGHRMDVIYEFIDLPGVGEGFRDFNFESLVRLVASDSNAIVPIVSFKEIPCSDWERLPELVAGGFNGRANAVVCTHLDQVSQENMDEGVKAVAKKFWPKGFLNTNRVIPCSSLMGLSAMDLLDRSTPAKPPFKAIWNKDSVGYHCAAKILGVEEPRATYGLFDTQTWRDKLQAELRASGLPGAIQELTKEMVDSARVNTLLREADAIARPLRELSNVQKRRLLEARRTKDDYNSAKRRHNQAREQLQATMGIWDREYEHEQIQENLLLLEKASPFISRKADELVGLAIERVLQNWRLGDIQLEDGDLSRGSRGAIAGEKGGVKVLTVRRIAHAEEFLRLSQRELHSGLNTVKLEYVTAIRKLAEAAKDKRFKVLRDAIELQGAQLQPNLREEFIGDLESWSIDIRKVASQQIRSVIKTTATRHTAPTAFRAIKERIARPVLGCVTSTMSDGEPDPDLGEDAKVTVQRSIDELGFMLRAPITALATVPFVFGLPIWPWMVRSRAYHLGMDVVHSLYKNEIVDPWIRSLKEEGEKSLIGTIELSSNVAKALVISALEREDRRLQRELDGKNKPVDQGTVQHLISMYGNLVAAEEALRELSIRVEGLQARSRQ